MHLVRLIPPPRLKHGGRGNKRGPHVDSRSLYIVKLVGGVLHRLYLQD